MDTLLGLILAFIWRGFNDYLNYQWSRVSKFGIAFDSDGFIDFTKHRPDLQIWNYDMYTTANGIVVVFYPLVSAGFNIWWCDVPLLFVYDANMLFVLGILFSETYSIEIVSYFYILLAWCVEGSHGLSTIEGFDTLVLASGLLFGNPAVYICLRWSHSYLANLYGNDYHLQIPTFEEDNMAYLAYSFIQMLEVPFLD